MQRRRLRVVCSSSDEEDDAVSHQLPPPLYHEIPPIQVDDDEEEVRSDQISHSEVGFSLRTINLSSSNSNSVNPNISRHNPNVIEPVPFNISDDEMDDDVHEPSPINSVSFGDNPVYDGINSILRRMGLGLKREWLEACVGALLGYIQGFSGLDDSQKSKFCFEQFLFADMNYCGSGVLPRDVHKLHMVDLKGPYILQVDEMVNISSPLRSRYQKAAPGLKRCLKLSMTDGVQRVFGMEYRAIKDLEVLSPAGLKIVICNVNIRRGILMLVPEVIEVLGGKVEELDAAQQRLVHEINKPARGKRTQVVQKLSERATLAAWPSETVNVQDQINNSRTVGMPFHVDVPGTLSRIPSSGIPASDGTGEHHRGNGEANQSSAADVAGIHFVPQQAQPSGRINGDENVVPISGEEVAPNLPEAMDFQEFQMLEELEPSFMLTGERESPFTYLASLSAKWATMKDTVSQVQGKIKCFLTGVKGFQYKRRSSYELLVYIDDGSLISEILIDHNVVQKGIGYSPEEVSKALTSSNSSQVNQMKETLKQFQIFLVNFEMAREGLDEEGEEENTARLTRARMNATGTMLVQISEESSVPVAIEMNKGCPVSDAWLLQQRLSKSTSSIR